MIFEINSKGVYKTEQHCYNKTPYIPLYLCMWKDFWAQLLHLFKTQNKTKQIELILNLDPF